MTVTINVIETAKKLVEKTKNYSCALPYFFRWNGKPFTLIDHFLFEPLFKVEVPSQMLFMCGRQVGKTLSISAHQVLLCWLIPGFRRLVVAPLHVHVERMSVDYIRPLIDFSPFKNEFVNNECRRTIMEKSFTNNSNIRLCSMHTDPTRIRGAPADAINYDEVQDIDLQFTDVVNECLSHSSWRLRIYTGTAKTLDNPIEWLWQRSSKAEWCIPCDNCKYENIASSKCDLLKMLGPVRPDISEEKPGLICAKCGVPISPRKGFWVHGNPQKRFDFVGYHIPQPLIPVHYSSPRAWAELLHKQENLVGGFASFKNEILGESEDEGVKLVSREDLVRNATLGPNTDENLFEKIKDYSVITMGIDWGGGGESGLSRTTIAIAAYKYGQCHILRGIRFGQNDPLEEVKSILYYFNKCRVNILAHDANPSGSLREILLMQHGNVNILPIQYYGSVGGKLLIKASNKQGLATTMRQICRLHKSRSIQILCAAIKLGLIKFFEYTDDNPEGNNLLLHFLAIFEEKVEHPMGEDQYLIQRNPALSDDFVHAVNFAVVALWELTAWPDFAVKFFNSSPYQDESQRR
jgi:hypothetical protein